MTYNTATGEIQRSTSSKRYKKDIVNLEVNTSKIYDLRPVSFTAISDNTRHFGLIAEEVAEVIPELVEYAREKDVIKGSTSEKLIPDAVQYPILSVLLLKEVQKQHANIEEQQKVIDEQKADINDLKVKSKEIDVLKQQNEDMQKQIDELKAIIKNK